MKKDYKIYLDTWRKVEAAIDGQPHITKYLYKYHTEIARKYNFRKKVSSYNNLPDTILQRWGQIYIRGNIAVNLASALLPIEKNIDGKKGTTKTLSKEIFDDIAMYGCAWLLVDLPKWDDRPDDPSELDRLEAGILPYVSVYTQPNIVDWAYSKNGELIMVTAKTGDHIVDDETNEVLPIYAIYVKGKRQKYVIIGQEKRLLGEPDKILFNGQPAMPWVVGGLQKYKTNPDYYKGQMNAIVDTAIELYNRSSANGSNYDKIGFAFLATGNQTDISQLGNQSVVKVGEGEPLPAFIQPASDCFEQYRLEIERLISNIFSLAGVKNRANSSDVAKSGAALAMEDSASANMVQLIADSTSEVIKNVWQLIKEANGSPDADVEIVFPESYDIDALQTELENLEQIFKLKNNAFYLRAFSNFIKRKVSDPKQQAEIMNEAKNSVGLRLSTLPDAATIDKLLSMGTLSPVDLAKEVNPTLKGEEDDAVLEWINTNMSFMGKVQLMVPTTE